jgi:hypothetical protein
LTYRVVLGFNHGRARVVLFGRRHNSALYLRHRNYGRFLNKIRTECKRVVNRDNSANGISISIVKELERKRNIEII